MAVSSNSVVRWPLLENTINQVKVRFVDKTTYSEEMEKKLDSDSFETEPIDWESEFPEE